jgi:hypothetical protein
VEVWGMARGDMRDVRVWRGDARAVEVCGMASGDVRAVRRRIGKSRTRWWRW